MAGQSKSASATRTRKAAAKTAKPPEDDPGTVDGTATELPPEPGDQAAADPGPEQTPANPGAGVMVPAKQTAGGVIVPMDAEQVVHGMELYQSLLPRLLADSDWQKTNDGKFVKKSGWRKIARAFGLCLSIEKQTIERDEDGGPVRAHVIVRALHPGTGQYQDGDGYCSISEPRFRRDSARQKVENDLRATATTRAKNRAIGDLVGMGEVSAEEVQAGASDGDGGPRLEEWQEKAVTVAQPALVKQVGNALRFLFNPEDLEEDRDVADELAHATFERVQADFDGNVPYAAARALAMAALVLKQRMDTGDEPAAGGDGDANQE